MQKDYEILLSSLFENGTLNTTEAEHIIYMSKKNQVLKVHKPQIAQRKDGRFYTYIYQEGVRQQKNFYSEKDLYYFLYDFYFGRSKISLEKLFPEFMLYRRNRGKVSLKTLEENMHDWNKFLKDSSIVKLPICDLTVKSYIDFFEELTKDGTYTAKAIGNLKSLLNKMYDYAIREDIVNYNPIKSIDFKEFKYFIPCNDDKVYKNSDRIKLLNYLADKKEPYALAIRLMFQLPVRVGELKNLKWDNIDLESRTLIIDGQVLEERKMNDDLSFSKQEVISVNHTKKNTPQGKRRLWLTKEAINILETDKSINPYGAFVFMPNDSLMLTDTFNRRLKKYTSEAGVPYYSSHKIRFTTASCLYNGKNLTQVSRALGHSQVSTTLHYFRNVENDEDLLEQMESAFSIK